jgi:hypothetical protein
MQNILAGPRYSADPWLGEISPAFDQIGDPIASFTADGAYEQDRVSKVVAERHIPRFVFDGGAAAVVIIFTATTSTVTSQ